MKEYWLKMNTLTAETMKFEKNKLSLETIIVVQLSYNTCNLIQPVLASQ